MPDGVNPALIEWLASCNKDPLAFAMGAFPWGEPGTTLEKFTGPTQWQIDVMRDIRDGLIDVNTAIRIAVASGHGIGKSCLVSILILWAFATAPDTRGVVTANTEAQLKTKTWAELGKWFNLFIAREHFTLTATALMSKDPNRERTWRIDMIPWSEKNPEAFAGLHNKGKRLLLIMDEASAILDIIHETAEGALTDSDTEIIWLMFGNPTRNTGRFKEAFPGGRFAHMWNSRSIDSRDVPITNKELIAGWIKAYGEDSDFVRIRVKGEFPRTGEMEFISAADVDEATAREPTVHFNEALVIGVDVARYGANESVIFFRKGRDAQTIPPIRLRGVNTVELAAKVVEAFNRYHVDAIFVDGGGVGGGVVDNLRALHLFCFDVNFGSKSDNLGFVTGASGEQYANKRSEMWGSMRAWLRSGGSIPNIPDLKQQLMGPSYGLNNRMQIQLEKKEDMMRRGVESPDLADALALTFAYPVQAHANAGGDHPQKPLVEWDYNPFDEKRMVA